jgi:predicted ArsR family transcriptional regulator
VDHRTPGLRAPPELRNVGVVKYQVQPGKGVVASVATSVVTSVVTSAVASATTPDGRTRDRVAQLLLERGAATAAQLGEQLGLSPAAIRKHLDAMLADRLVETREVRSNRPRGRGRPAKAFVLTAAARESFPHFYDGIATAALRWIADNGGSAAVSAFAAAQVSALEERCRAALQEAGDDPIARAEALAEALTAEGYAANATAIASGGQLCQHHCPVAHVAAEFPQLCDAETEVISRLIGTHVQRLATIAHGDGVCTTHIPASALWSSAPAAGPGAGTKQSPVRVTAPTTVRTDT